MRKHNETEGQYSQQQSLILLMASFAWVNNFILGLICLSSYAHNLYKKHTEKEVQLNELGMHIYIYQRRWGYYITCVDNLWIGIPIWKEKKIP